MGEKYMKIIGLLIYISIVPGGCETVKVEQASTAEDDGDQLMNSPVS